MKHITMCIILFLTLGCNSFTEGNVQTNTNTQKKCSKEEQRLHFLNSLLTNEDKKEIELIKKLESFDSLMYKDINNNKTIGYGFTKFWFKGEKITKYESDTLIIHIYLKLKVLATNDYKNSNNIEKVSHLYYWLGRSESRNYITKDGDINKQKLSKNYTKYKKRLSIL